jgi:hypothetical protein
MDNIMKNILVKTRLAAASLFVMTGLLSTFVIAQDENKETNRVRMEERRVEMQQRRAEFLESNPEAAARMEERRREREEFLANNPEAAARIEERRARMRERIENGEGRPPRGQRPGFEGRRQGPPSGFERDDRPRLRPRANASAG